jgi:hypothetical protein
MGMLGQLRLRRATFPPALDYADVGGSLSREPLSREGSGRVEYTLLTHWDCRSCCEASNKPTRRTCQRLMTAKKQGV